jgi:hypothetical protein
VVFIHKYYNNSKIASSLGEANSNDQDDHCLNTTDIIMLVNDIAKLKSDLLFRTQNIVLTVQMLAHFAFLVRFEALFSAV